MAPRATVRLSRLTQDSPDAQLDMGWLIEPELDPNAPLLAGDCLPQALREMRLLGLQPTLLTPPNPCHDPTTRSMTAPRVAASSVATASPRP